MTADDETPMAAYLLADARLRSSLLAGGQTRHATQAFMAYEELVRARVTLNSVYGYAYHASAAAPTETEPSRETEERLRALGRHMQAVERVHHAIRVVEPRDVRRAMRDTFDDYLGARRRLDEAHGFSYDP